MISSLVQLPPLYLLWHYTVAWVDLFRLYQNVTWFLWHFFSIGVLFRTLFSPWRRLHEEKSKRTAGLLGSVIINLILRAVGFVARFATILFGLTAIVLLLVCFAILLLVWPFLPLVIVLLITQGIIGMVTG